MASWKLLWLLLAFIQEIASQSTQNSASFSYQGGNILDQDTPVSVDPASGTCGAAKHETIHLGQDCVWECLRSSHLPSAPQCDSAAEQWEMSQPSHCAREGQVQLLATWM